MKKENLLIIIGTITAIVIFTIFIFREKNIFQNQQQVESTILNNLNTMKISSPAFENNESIPSKYTCEGENINPPLLIENVPSETKSLVLIVDDPDAPRGTFIHWVVFNIPPQTKLIEENSIPEGALLGKNDANDSQYYGPCPPSGKHRYFFHLYALDIALDLKNGTDLSEIKSAMRNHILDETELIGTYQRI